MPTSHEFSALIIDYVTPFWDGAWWAIRYSWWLMVIIFIAEVFYPKRRLTWFSVFVNALYTPIFLTIAGAFLHLISDRIAPYVPANLVNFHMMLDATVGGIASVLMYLFLFDFLYYWLHRLQHTVPFFWRYHAFHHADINTSMISSARHHWAEEFLRYFAITIPMLIVVGPSDQIPLQVNAFIGMYGLFIHWNAPFRLGVMDRFIVTPWYHRIHHSIEEKHYNKNFVVFFPFIDQMFGTAWHPGPDEFPVTGIAGLRSPYDWRMLMPFPTLRMK